MVKAYEAAKYDLLVISDSSIRSKYIHVYIMYICHGHVANLVISRS